MATDHRFDVPLYSFSEAARYVGMPASTFTTWAKGYERRPSGRPRVRQGPIITSLEPQFHRGPSVPFIGLVEANVVQAFRKTGLPLQRIRRALQVLSEQGELEHALASHKLFSDGAEILYDYANTADEPTIRLLTLTTVTTGQRVFHEVILDYLKRITFNDDTWATSLVLPITTKAVLEVRPDVASGQPLFIRGGAPLSAISSRYKAGEPLKSIAADFEVPEDDIAEALGVTTPQAA